MPKPLHPPHLAIDTRGLEPVALIIEDDLVAEAVHAEMRRRDVPVVCDKPGSRASRLVPSAQSEPAPARRTRRATSSRIPGHAGVMRAAVMRGVGRPVVRLQCRMRHDVARHRVARSTIQSTMNTSHDAFAATRAREARAPAAGLLRDWRARRIAHAIVT